ncbi:MAG: DUF4142 domain-containing protein [Pseudomonadota bacterium]|jgi:putative membrane protein
MKNPIAAVLATALLGQVAWAAELTAEEFVTKASEAGIAEAQLGALAARKGASAEVRAYGERMVADHGHANRELEALAKSKGLEVAREPGLEFKQAVEELDRKSGADFDAAFTRRMVADHAEAVALFTSASRLADKELAGFASRTLPTLQDHHQKAQHLAH